MSISRPLVDPELDPLLSAFPVRAWSLETLPTIRADLSAAVAAQLAARAPDGDVVRTDLHVPGPPGAPPVAIAIYAPVGAGRGLPVYFDIHGGGFIAGSVDMKDGQYRRLVGAAGCVFISVDYRLAPETRFPGQIEDCFAALRWVAANAEARGWDGERIVLGGDSAGGGLAAALALLVRDTSDIRISHIFLNAPMLDDRPTSRPGDFTGEFVWREDDNRFGWQCLLGENYGGSTSCYAAPARAETLEGFPPTFLAVGALDLFLEQDLEFAKRLAVAGVPLEVHVYPGAFHGFHVSPDAEVARRYFADQIQAIRKAFGLPTQRKTG